jgi:hypothetical protein
VDLKIVKEAVDSYISKTMGTSHFKIHGIDSRIEASDFFRAIEVSIALSKEIRGKKSKVETGNEDA